MIQTSSILPYFKDQGWFVTLNTTERGFGIIKNDPHIDEVFLQGNNQVANAELSSYWEKLSKHFTKFVQLSESIEGKLLALPDRPQYRWSKKLRHQRMNKDYFKQMHDLSGAALPPRPKFYPTEMEKIQAKQVRDQAGCFLIMWVLSGSSVHKAWPYVDNVVAALLLNYPGVWIVFVGEELCQLLEEPWKNEKRVIRKSGRWDIRNTLTLSQQVDMVIGPETGVLNCVAYEDIPKIILLSHSSAKNFGAKFVNTTTIKPKGVSCYPCHKLHYRWRTCNRDEKTGAAMCQANIRPDRVYQAIVEKIEKIGKRKAA